MRRTGRGYRGSAPIVSCKNMQIFISVFGVLHFLLLTLIFRALYLLLAIIVEYFRDGLYVLLQEQVMGLMRDGCPP